ncbi:hypothetical protein PTSG_04310 [Salpingoeca rosetta]|uniref:KATNIP domain-containing protein n=1 Tax=Salpingoeca rosetta (strain ATCC 50818 / BSB-021) TaxID=946362 RepID=F2U866_SALR5|nr:uncharacterized protein PTSG_04310 [Salpingoeca rosetta]EGD72574.1 hypothetical protein PTSG_04310 [Salpingoeca rosetta]|eukprot:XP_004994397.1 hypothetical protein PTSG_04310 [Salpingoeca rosetta]
MSRKGWKRPDDVAIKDLQGNAPRVEDQVDPQYDEYLALLQERNRILKRMKKKTDEEVERERKEAGFSLYVNGPHRSGRDRRATPGSRTGSARRRPLSKRQGSSRGGRADAADTHTDGDDGGGDVSPNMERPPGSRRRNWQPADFEIRTGQGQRRTVVAPSILTGAYEDDFDADEQDDDDGDGNEDEDEVVDETDARGGSVSDAHDDGDDDDGGDDVAEEQHIRDFDHTGDGDADQHERSGEAAGEVVRESIESWPLDTTTPTGGNGDGDDDGGVHDDSLLEEGPARTQTQSPTPHVHGIGITDSHQQLEGAVMDVTQDIPTVVGDTTSALPHGDEDRAAVTARSDDRSDDVNNDDYSTNGVRSVANPHISGDGSADHDADSVDGGRTSIEDDNASMASADSFQPGTLTRNTTFVLESPAELGFELPRAEETLRPLHPDSSDNDDTEGDGDGRCGTSDGDEETRGGGTSTVARGSGGGGSVLRAARGSVKRIKTEQATKAGKRGSHNGSSTRDGGSDGGDDAGKGEGKAARAAEARKRLREQKRKLAAEKRRTGAGEREPWRVEFVGVEGQATSVIGSTDASTSGSSSSTTVSLEKAWKRLKRHGRSLIIRPKSTWTDWVGVTQDVGLTKIEVLDAFLQPIAPGPNTWLLAVNDAFDAHTHELLTSGPANTTDAAHMWLYHVQDDAWPALRLRFEASLSPSTIRIVNYNRPNCETNGVHTIAIEDDAGALLWSGQLTKGTGRRNKPPIVEAELSWPSPAEEDGDGDGDDDDDDDDDGGGGDEVDAAATGEAEKNIGGGDHATGNADTATPPAPQHQHAGTTGTATAGRSPAPLHRGLRSSSARVSRPPPPWIPTADGPVAATPGSGDDDGERVHVRSSSARTPTRARPASGRRVSSPALWLKRAPLQRAASGSLLRELEGATGNDGGGGGHRDSSSGRGSRPVSRLSVKAAAAAVLVPELERKQDNARQTTATTASVGGRGDDGAMERSMDGLNAFRKLQASRIDAPDFQQMLNTSLSQEFRRLWGAEEREAHATAHGSGDHDDDGGGKEENANAVMMANSAFDKVLKQQRHRQDQQPHQQPQQRLHADNEREEMMAEHERGAHDHIDGAQDQLFPQDLTQQEQGKQRSGADQGFEQQQQEQQQHAGDRFGAGDGGDGGAYGVAVSTAVPCGIFEERPMGQRVVLHLHSTWGDPHYIGLTGVEVFSPAGHSLRCTSVTADPPDLRIISGYDQDPRVVDNLVDGTNCTCDAMHMWLCPWLGPHHSHTVTLLFPQQTEIGAVRVWNYNESRTSSYRGVRELSLHVDGRCVFRGEIRQATGSVSTPHELFELLLFVPPASGVLQGIEAFDAVQRARVRGANRGAGRGAGVAGGNDDGGGGEGDGEGDGDEDGFLPPRPATRGEDGPVDISADAAAVQQLLEELQGDDGGTGNGCAGGTGGDDAADAGGRGDGAEGGFQLPVFEDTASGFDETPVGVSSSSPATSSAASTSTLPKGTRFQLNFVETWGDPYYLGLTGLQLIDEHGGVIAVSMRQVEAVPRDLNDLPNVYDDDRTLDKLFDGTNITTDDEHMWLIPFTPTGDHLITFFFDTPTTVSALRFYNYNKSADDIYRGAKRVFVSVDDTDVSPSGGYLICIAPGSAAFDFAHTVSLHPRHRRYPPASIHHKQLTPRWNATNSYIVPAPPRVLRLSLRLIDTWGDLHYIGLNGLQLLDAFGAEIPLTPQNIHAVPESVNVLPGVSGDARTPDKLVDGHYNTNNDYHMWLTPHTPGKAAVVEVLLPQPIMLGALKLWNYSKTPKRGVRHLQLWADGRIMFEGFVHPGQQQRGHVALPFGTDMDVDHHQAIVFAPNLLDKPDLDLHPMRALERAVDKVILINDGVWLTDFPLEKQASHHAPRPKTSVVGSMC